MNSLFRKFLLYNFFGLLILIVSAIFIIIFLNNYQLNKRLKQIDNQSLIIYNFLKTSNLLRDIKTQLSTDVILSKLEIKNLSIIIMDENMSILLDTKGYDLENSSFANQSVPEVEIIDENSSTITSSLDQIENLANRDFLNHPTFLINFKNLEKGTQKNFSIELNKDKLELVSILPISYDEIYYYIVAHEDNTNIQNINNQIQLNVLLAGLAIGGCLILFSFFLNFIILKPIRNLANAAEKVQMDYKTKPLISGLDRRDDEIGQLSKIINEMLNSLYNKIDNAENNSADLMHEIRNPLASIKMASEVITDKMASEVITDKMSDSQKKFLNLIQNDISRIESIITDYSAMIKNEVNLYKSQLQKFEIKSLLHEIIEDTQKVLPDQIQIKFLYDQDNQKDIFVDGQKKFFSQAIKNIIDNAISFSPKPGIIKVLLSSTSNYLSIAIVDEGPGIKEPDMKRIFERFYSLREEDNKSHSGLGLNIAKQIIDAHEGSISVDNVMEENDIKGAKFIVNLPQVNINK